MKVVGFDFGVGVVDFVVEIVWEDSLDRIVDIGIIENIYHRDFSFLVSKVATKNSNYLVGAKYTSGC